LNVGIEDRDWYREDRKRRQKLAGGDDGRPGFAAITSTLRQWRGRGARRGARDLLRWALLAVAIYALWSVFRR
jgi:hypothetical protein